MAVTGGRATSALRPVAAQLADGPATVEVSWFDIRQITLGPADLADLDVRETARAAAFVFPADRHRYQVAHVMLRRVLAGHLDAEPGSLVFGRDPCPTCGRPSGKPVLARPLPPMGASGAADPMGASGTAGPGGPGGKGRPGLCFSLAHSGDSVAIAVASQPVGVDVERNATGCVCSLVTAMHPSDAEIVGALPEPERHVAVIRWWVRAEAVLKCAGTGIGHGMDAFAVLSGPARNKISAGHRLSWEPDAAGWSSAPGCSFAPLSAPRGYQAAIALPGLRLIRYRWGSGNG
jgi:phosphopantetheinyl transferase